MKAAALTSWTPKTVSRTESPPSRLASACTAVTIGP